MLKCNECDSPKIWVYMWVEANTYEVQEECAGDDCWCQDCDRVTTYRYVPEETDGTTEESEEESG